ncbi:hypothetical protein [Pseudonocardia sp.]|jgi:uncharacterized membrane protein|uniref:hypothetical protein n=1 Tax=Pseudonocardia sp. TaxID=60912 RepID=UPI0031FD42E7
MSRNALRVLVAGGSRIGHTIHMKGFDQRSEGFEAEFDAPDHPVLGGTPARWPSLHRAPPEFVQWPHHARLWTSILSWAARVGSDSRTVPPVSAGTHG